ncbi:MAG: DUF4115 domain-containing protein [Gammaproteobacteria bacterium]
MDEQTDAQAGNQASMTIGASLRDAREARNLSIENAAQQLHLDVKLLKALEAEDFASFPAPAYTYGYLRSYVRLLKLPEEEILQKFLAMTRIDSNMLVPEHMTFAEKNKVPVFSVGQILFMVLSAVLVIGAIVWVLSGDILERSLSERDAPVGSTLEGSAEETSENIETVIVSMPDDALIETLVDETLSIEEKQQAEIPDSIQVKHVEPTAAPTPAKALQLSYSADSWTEVRDANGETLIYRMVRKGEHLELEGAEPYTILLGYVPGVSVHYRGVEFDTRRYQRDDIAYFRIGQQGSIPATVE